MGLVGVIVALFLISFNCNIKPSTSRKNDDLEPKNFISFGPNAIEQRPCNCAMPNQCSCCEIVTIFYTMDERRLCFNMVYRQNGLNVDLSLDNMIIRSMTVANYRPFRLCASVPGLLLSSICVNVADINQLARTIVVCPRFEISTKIKRWQIGYVCQNVSTTQTTGIPAQMNPPAVTVMPRGTMMMPVIMMMIPAATPAAGARPGITAAPAFPGGATPGMTQRPAAPGAAPLGGAMPATAQRPAAPGAAPSVGAMAGMPGSPAMAQRPGTSGPAPLGSGAPSQQMVPIVGMIMMGTNAAGPPMMPPPTGPQPPAQLGSQRALAPAPPSPTAPMVSGGTVVQPPADGPIQSIKPVFPFESDNQSNNFGETSADAAFLDDTSSTDSTVISVQADELGKRSTNESVIDIVMSDEEKETTPSGLNETTDDLKTTIEDTTEPANKSEKAESTRTLNRKKRQYDVFDIFQQSNRCDRAYKICITRSNNYIVSRLRPTRFSGSMNKKMECNEKPTKIVPGPGVNLCSYLTSVMDNNSESTTVTSQSNGSNSQSSDSLDAIIVNDDTEDDSDFYFQHYPQIASIVPYNRPRNFPPRTPPAIISQMQESLKNLTNDALIIKAHVV